MSAANMATAMCGAVKNEDVDLFFISRKVLSMLAGINHQAKHTKIPNKTVQQAKKSTGKRKKLWGSSNRLIETKDPATEVSLRAVWARALHSCNKQSQHASIQ